MKGLFEITGCENGAIRDANNNLALMKWGQRNGIPQILTCEEIDPRLACADEKLKCEDDSLDFNAMKMLNEEAPFEMFHTWRVWNQFEHEILVTVVKGKNE